jgi:hypothetical protein
MRKSNQHLFREMLRANHDGISVPNISKATGLEPRGILRSLRCMPDAYIDRWEIVGRRKRMTAVWCVVVPPENCPKPERL